MFIRNKTSIGFTVPEEIYLAEKFRYDHPDWKEESIASYICFGKEVTNTYGVYRDDESDQQNM